MQVAAPSLFNVSSQLQLQSAQSARSNRVGYVQQRMPSEEDVVSRRTDPETAQHLTNLGRMHGALLSALKNNLQIEESYLFDTVR